MAKAELVKFQDKELKLGKFELQPTALVKSGEVSASDLRHCGDFLSRAEGAVQWWIGDWANMIPKKDGDHKEAVRELSEACGLDRSTVDTCAWVCRSVKTSIRIEVLSFLHHRVVAKLPPAEQKRWLKAAADNGWSVSQLRQAMAGDKREQLALTLKEKYQVFYADPPWDYNNAGFVDAGAVVEQYPTMSTEDICNIWRPEYCTEDAVLFLWGTNPLMDDVFDVLDFWGFEYRTNIVWIKDRPTYLGFYVKGCHEYLLIGTRGSMLPAEGVNQQSVVNAPRTKHSKKPEIFYEIIETMYPGLKYCELFARGKRPGWESWGNEV